MIAAAEVELADRLQALLTREKLLNPEFALDRYSTPRRLALRMSGVLPQQPDLEETLTGPAVAIAYKGGEPTPAAHAFAKKAGVELSQLTTTVTPKGEYVAAKVHRKGEAAIAVLAGQLPRELAALYWPKNMYWRAGKPERFVRPLRWLLALLDGEIIPVEFGGIAASHYSYGHRILYGDVPIEIANGVDYLEKLEAAYVLPDVEARRHKIRKALDSAARSVPGIRWREDHPLVDTVTHLTEWPSVLLGCFEVEYLSLPEEVLVTVMRDHQKYFALEDSSGKLAPYFLTVLNTEANAEGEAIIRHGNERVLRARFNDAQFFWDFDQRVPLVDRIEMLKSVTFQKDLGSYFAKTESNTIVAGMLADVALLRGATLDKPALLMAVRLAKADLTAELVKEFTELQGVVGGLYARAQGLGEVVSSAIYWQYRPASGEDPIPPSVEGQILGVADRINSIVDMFAIDLKPTGSKDPFALRRAASGVVKILAEGELPLSLADVCKIATQASGQANASANLQPVRQFLRERLEFYLRENRNFAYDVVAATLAAADSDIPDAIARGQALTAVRGSQDFNAISSAFKRIKNILRQAAEKQAGPLPSEVDEGLLSDDAEKALYAEAIQLAAAVEKLRVAQRYTEALEQIATLRPGVDRFFDTVMVMAPEPEIRQNRIALIATVLREFSKIADFSEIVVA
ncbi:Glycyl-tRNA synthetase beta chain [Acidisarcina polymorpha]|uniref:Glycine--tRNA ligase beta subunit n=2 Tax=Acidisarcina polymorpha TaxID=2211140 RepID=A0A2Z5G9A5_9BACT|nr:Glycyl-tRNA synthetase beta chain [Acidisarcina polymorpha]